MSTSSRKPDPLDAMVGNLWVPFWAIRPGSYTVLRPIADCMPLWLVLHSRIDAWRPCFHSREQIGDTLGCGHSRISRQLKQLRDAYLVFEVDRGMDRKTSRHRPPARWALDPFTADLWRPKVEEVLAQVAEEDGHDGRWYRRAVTSLEAFESRSGWLMAEIRDSMRPRLAKPKTRKKAKRRNRSRRAAAQNESSAQNEPRGDGFSRVVGSMKEKPVAAGGVRSAAEERTSESGKNGAPSSVGHTRDRPESNVA